MRLHQSIGQTGRYKVNLKRLWRSCQGNQLKTRKEISMAALKGSRTEQCLKGRLRRRIPGQPSLFVLREQS